MVITIRDTTTGTEYVNGRNHWSFYITIREKVDFSYSSVRRHYANESVDSFHGLYHLRNLYSIGSVESMQSRTSMRGRSRDQSSKRGINATATDALLVDVAPNVFRIPSLHIMSE